MSRTNETRFIEWHGTCKCECKFEENGKNYIFRCEGKELIDKGLWDKGFMWNPSNCECECDKACNVGEYLDQENCKCRKILVEKWVDEIVEEVKLAKLTLAENENSYKCSWKWK